MSVEAIATEEVKLNENQGMILKSGAVTSFIVRLGVVEFTELDEELDVVELLEDELEVELLDAVPAVARIVIDKAEVVSIW